MSADNNAVAASSNTPPAAPLTWELLGAHQSMTLLMDLVHPDGPGSLQILLDEGLPDGEWWAVADLPVPLMD